MEKKFLHCPECGEPLSVPEYNAQECWLCGWPDEDKAPDTTTKQQDNVPEQCDTGRGLTPFFKTTDDSPQTTVENENRYSSELYHSKLAGHNLQLN